MDRLTIWERNGDRWMIVRTYGRSYVEYIFLNDGLTPGKFGAFPEGVNPNTQTIKPLLVS